MVPKTGLYEGGIAEVLDRSGNPLFQSDDRSNRTCFSLSLFVGVRLGLS